MRILQWLATNLKSSALAEVDISMEFRSDSIYIVNNRDPRTLPRITPDITGLNVEDTPTLTAWERSERKLLIQAIIFPK